MATTIGEAYLQIRPSMEGVKSELEKEMGAAGSSGSSSFGSAFASGIKKVGAVTAAAVGAASAGVTALTKSAVSAYADYEQLVGGVETLFGQGGNTLEEYAKTVRATARDIEEAGIDWDKYMNTAWMSEGGGVQSLFDEIQFNINELGTSAEDLEEYLHFEYDLDTEDAKAAIQSYYDAISDETIAAKYEAAGRAQEAVMQHAAEAYKTAGMSANDYMETVTSFSASLLQSLGGDTEEAARVADMAIIDMADNANKMGSSMESIQNAYQGFAKQNYTMLDNLKLGYGGTKEEMQRLLTDAEALSGVEYDMSNLNDVYEAIHVIQESMGIAGTTAKEGASTISGSIASMGAAWQNLVTGFADPDADLSTLIGNVINSGTTALDNLMPVIEQTLVGIADALVQIAPVIADKLPALIESLLPPLIQAATTLFDGILQALPEIFAAIIPILPDLISTIVDTILTMLPQLIDLGMQLLLALADGIIQNLPTLIPAVIDVILTIVDKLTDPDTILQLIDAALQIMIALAEGLINALPKLIEKAPTIIMNLVQAIIKAAPRILEAGVKLITTLVQGILSVVSKVVQAGATVANAAKDAIMGILNKAKEWGKDLIMNFVQGIKDKINAVKDAVSNVANTVKDFLGFSEPDYGPLSNFHTFAPDMLELFTQGIKNNVSMVKDAMGDLAGAVATEWAAPELASPNYSAVADPNERLYGYMSQGQLAAAGEGDICIPVYIGNEKLDELIISAQQRANYRSGGR